MQRMQLHLHDTLHTQPMVKVQLRLGKQLGGTERRDPRGKRPVVIPFWPRLFLHEIKNIVQRTYGPGKTLLI